jgi:hypothetical protein
MTPEPEQLTPEQEAAALRLADRLADRGVKRPHLVPVRDANDRIIGWRDPASGDSATVRHR